MNCNNAIHFFCHIRKVSQMMHKMVLSEKQNFCQLFHIYDTDISVYIVNPTKDIEFMTR